MADMPAMGPGLLGLGLWHAFPDWRGRIAGALFLALGAQMKQTVLVLYPLLVLELDGHLTRQRWDWGLVAVSLLLAGAYPKVAPYDAEQSSIVGLVVWILQTTWNPQLIPAKIGYVLATGAAVLLTPLAYGVAVAWRRTPSALMERIRLIGYSLMTIPLLSAAGFWTSHRTGGLALMAPPPTLSTMWFYLGITTFVAWLLLAARNSDWPGPTRWLVSWLLLASTAAVIGTWLPGVRHLIPALPPLAFLFLLDLERSGRVGLLRVGATLAIAGNLWLSASLAHNDMAFSRWSTFAAKQGADLAAARHLPLLTTGSWGLRYYTERLGGRILQHPDETLTDGAILLCPTVTDHRTLPRALRRRSHRIGMLVLPSSVPWPAVTVPSVESSASFHGGHVWFPYAFMRSPAETIEILEIRPQ
jgi:hypothetical protein